MNLSLYLLCLLVLVGLTEAHLRTKSFKYKDNHKSYARNILQTLSVSSVAKCAYQCTANKDCEDANFDKHSKFCHLLRKKPESVLLALVEQPGVLYLGDVDEIEYHDYRKKNKEYSSCKTIYDSGRSTGSKAYNLSFGMNAAWSMTYCMMDATTECGPGGWTLVMKIDGEKKVFNFDNAIWTDMTAYNEPAGQTGIQDLTETKMPTFWRTPFTKICLGMKSLSTGNVNWMTIDKTADSLHSLLADGTEVLTNLGRSAWVSLFPDHVLQSDSCKDGFNIDYGNQRGKSRIGVAADGSSQCSGPNSYIGFGTQSSSYSVSCGSSSTKQTRAVPSNCFIFVQ